MPHATATMQVRVRGERERRPGHHAGQHLADDRQAGALVAARGPERLGGERGGGVRGRPALGVEAPAQRDRAPLGGGEPDLAKGDLAERHVQHDRLVRGAPRDGVGDRVVAGDRGSAARGHDDRLRVRGQPADEAGGGGALRVERAHAEVVAVADADEADRMLACQLDRGVHRERCRGEAVAAARIDEGGRAAALDDAHVGVRLDLAGLDRLHVLREPQHAVAVHPAQVRRDEAVRRGGRVAGRETRREQDPLGEGAQLVGSGVRHDVTEPIPLGRVAA